MGQNKKNLQDKNILNVAQEGTTDESESDSDSSDFSDSDVDEQTENRDVENNDDEDEVVRAIRLEKEKKRDHPPDIEIEDSITDICFHPENDLIAVSNNVGDAMLYKYSVEGNELVSTLELHTKASRVIEFNADGSLLFSAGKDKSVMVTDMATSKLKTFYENVHPQHIYTLKVICENTFVTGDDFGGLRMWDLRSGPKNIFTLKLGEEYISDVVTTETKQFLACAGGDGTLSSIDLNTRKIHVQSEEYQAELTCLGLFRGDTKLLVGSSRGKMYLFNWGEFGLHSDEYTGLKRGISCMVPITENIVIASGEDGILRAAHLFPHRQLGIVGQHDLPVEKLDISNDGHLIASCTLNETVKFWNVNYFERVEEVINLNKKQNKRRDMSNNLPSSKYRNASDFFSGMT